MDAVIPVRLSAFTWHKSLPSSVAFGEKRVPNLKTHDLIRWLEGQEHVGVRVHKNGHGKHSHKVEFRSGDSLTLSDHASRSDGPYLTVFQQLAQFLGFRNWHKLYEFVKGGKALHFTPAKPQIKAA